MLREVSFPVLYLFHFLHFHIFIHLELFKKAHGSPALFYFQMTDWLPSRLPTCPQARCTTFNICSIPYCWVSFGTLSHVTHLPSHLFRHPHFHRNSSQRSCHLRGSRVCCRLPATAPRFPTTRPSVKGRGEGCCRAKHRLGSFSQAPPLLS